MGPDDPDVMRKIWSSKFSAINSLARKKITLEFPSQEKQPVNLPPPGWLHSPLSGPDLPCKYCSMKFANPKKLRKHEQKHEDPRNHWCKICNRCFRTPQALDRHTSFRHDMYQFTNKKTSGSKTLPPTVPAHQLQKAKQFYEEKFILSFPRL